MNRLLTATAILAFLAAPALAQTNASPTLEENTVTSDEVQTKANDGDDALPGSANADTGNGFDMDATGSTTTYRDGRTSSDETNGTSSQPFTEGNSQQGRAQESTPSDGVVPGQDPE